jgi:arylsulfatase A-like enzyme
MLTDDHAYQAISAYGDRLAEIAPTPNIDRLADEGMRFDRATVTNSICAPSRAVIQTGKYSHLNGTRDNIVEFDGTQQTFPKLLQQAGYATAMIGKWHLKSEPTGFDFWAVLPQQGHYYNPDFRTPEGTVREPGYVTNLITNKSLTWLREQRNPDQPFLLMLQHKAPHRAWLPGPEHLNAFDEVTIPEPANLFDDYATRGTAAREQRMSIENDFDLDADLKVWTEDSRSGKRWDSLYGRMSTEQLATFEAAYHQENRAFLDAGLTGDDAVRWKYQRYMKDYLATIRSVDDSVGEILDYLDESSLADNTIVIYSSDQGFYLGEHGWYDKRFMYEESFRTPLLVRWPGVTEPGGVSDRLVSNLDYAETMLDMAGAPIPEDMQGLSLRPVLDGTVDETWRKSIYYRYYEQTAGHNVHPHEGVATDRYKLIHFWRLGEWELYDLEADPAEMRNLYDDPEYAGIVTELKAELQRLREQYAVGPEDDDYVVMRPNTVN